VKRASASTPASSPKYGTSTGAIALGWQFGSGHDHITGICIVWLSRLALARTVSEFPGCRVAYLGHEGFRSIDNRFKQLAGHYALRVAGFGQILETFSNEVLSGASIIGR
jgi:hypothetical protein